MHREALEQRGKRQNQPSVGGPRQSCTSLRAVQRNVKLIIPRRLIIIFPYRDHPMDIPPPAPLSSCRPYACWSIWNTPASLFSCMHSPCLYVYLCLQSTLSSWVLWFLQQRAQTTQPQVSTVLSFLHYLVTSGQVLELFEDLTKRALEMVQEGKRCLLPSLRTQVPSPEPMMEPQRLDSCKLSSGLSSEDCTCPYKTSV